MKEQSSTKSFSIDEAPDGDPLIYLEDCRCKVPEPNGLRMLTKIAVAIADGTATAVVQDASCAMTYRLPDHRSKRELRLRVRLRRRQAG